MPDVFSQFQSFAYRFIEIDDLTWAESAAALMPRALQCIFGNATIECRLHLDD